MSKRQRRLVVVNTDGPFGTSKPKTFHQLAKEHSKMVAERRALLQALPSETRAAANHMVRANGGITEDDQYHYDPMADPTDWVDDDDVGISANGGEVDDVVRIANEHIVVPQVIVSASSRHRRERLRNFYRNWDDQIPALASAYLQWKHKTVASMDSSTTGSMHEIRVLAVETYTSQIRTIPQFNDELANAALIRCGLLGTAPVHPSIAVDLRTLELYHRLRRRHPRLSVQAFCRALCDLHDVNYRTAFREQVSSAFDAYLDILRAIEKYVDVALGRNSADWRMKNSCVCCDYKLDAEPELSPAKLMAMDGNNSAKRIRNAGHEDERIFASNYFLSRAEVDKFKDEVKRRPKARVQAENSGSESDEDAPWLPESRPDDAESQPAEYDHSKCTERWKASAAEHKKRALDIYDATGMFASACRHGFIRIVCEMVQSGELAKYPLAVTDHIIDKSGDDVAIGLDNGCSLKSTISKSELLGAKAREHHFRLSVNSFHGYAHSRTCQLDNHPLYLKGWGIEDLEGMERIFSASNAVASTIRYATRYHYLQALDLHFKQWDMDKYSELGNFLLNNYRQCLNIIAENEPEIERLKTASNLTDQDFERWIDEERAFLHSLKDESEERILECAYVQALETRAKADEKWKSVSQMFIRESGNAASYASEASNTRRLESRRRAAVDELFVAIRTVGHLEAKLNVQRTWTPHDKEYQDAVQYLRRRDFHRALDRVERLVVQRLFELSKANIAGMGYKMRTSIWKALKKRGTAIRSALKQYNTLAQQLRPPAPVLEWKDVVNYAFVSEFDILRHSYSRSDITSRPWALQANREVTSRYFKVLHAREEIHRLHVEIQRLHTSLDDDEQALEAAAQQTESGDNDTPGNADLAAEIRAIRDSKIRVNRLHRQRIEEVMSLGGYSGPRDRGVHAGAGAFASVSTSLGQPPADDRDELYAQETEEEYGGHDLDDRTKEQLGNLGEFMEGLSVETGNEPDVPRSKDGIPLDMLSTIRF